MIDRRITAFDGMETGKLDDNGQMIKCGDKVLLCQPTKERVYVSFNGDGYTLSPPVPRKCIGVVVYDPAVTGFVVMFDNDAGYVRFSLRSVGRSAHSPDDRLTVITEP